MPRILRSPIALAFAVTLFATLVAAAPAAQAAVFPTLGRRYVCDFAFANGAAGKESRTFVASPNNYNPYTQAWWFDGGTGGAQMYIQVQSNLASGTRWALQATLNDGNVLTGLMTVLESDYAFARTKRITFTQLTNNVTIDCIELALGTSPKIGVLKRIRETFGGPNGVCQCGFADNYASTVACIENCASYWNNNNRWDASAPECLSTGSVVEKVACFAQNDPTGPYGNTDTCDIYPNSPQCDGYGAGDGGSCGWGNDTFCQPGLFCDATNHCVDLGGGGGGGACGWSADCPAGTLCIGGSCSPLY